MADEIVHQLRRQPHAQQASAKRLPPPGAARRWGRPAPATSMAGLARARVHASPSDLKSPPPGGKVCRFLLRPPTFTVRARVEGPLAGTRYRR